MTEKLAFLEQHLIRFLARYANRRVCFGTVFPLLHDRQENYEPDRETLTAFLCTLCPLWCDPLPESRANLFGMSRRSEIGSGQDA